MYSGRIYPWGTFDDVGVLQIVYHVLQFDDLVGIKEAGIIGTIITMRIVVVKNTYTMMHGHRHSCSIIITLTITINTMSIIFLVSTIITIKTTAAGP